MGKDLISELPDCVLHHILSFLDMVYVVPTCILSKRWRYIWTSMSYLCFDEKDFSSRTRYGVKGFCEYIDNVMSVRNSSNVGIHTLRVINACGSSESVVKWINNVVQHGVVVLDITIASNVVLPQSLLNCKSLQTLSFNLRGPMWYLTLEQPDSVYLPALKSLRLEQLAFFSEDIKTLISRCSVLDTLVVSSCIMVRTNNLIVHAPQLKHLEVLKLCALEDNPGEEQLFYPMITAFTSYLASFKCDDYWIMGGNSHLNNASPLVRAELDLSGFHNSDNSEELFAGNVKICLSEISQVKALFLKLPAWLLQAVFVPPAQQSDLQILFNSLTILKLRTTVVEQQTHARSYLLETCPSLETLVLDILEEPNSYVGNETKLSSVDEESLLSKLPIKCISHHLKVVEIHGRALRLENEFVFVKFLLQNASVLEAMSFQHGRFCQRSRVLKFLKEVKAITRASRNVKISLLDW